MKSYRIALTAISFVLFLTNVPSVIAGGNCSSKSCKNESKAAQYQKYADSYDKQAEKAKSNGLTQVAAALEKCAAAKRKIAYGYETGNQSTLNAGYAAYKQARAELKKAKEAAYGSCSSKKSTCTSSSKSKDTTSVSTILPTTKL